MVESAKKYIREGDIFQVVLSNPLSAAAEGSLFDTYRVLRTTNPSPYMFYFSSDDIEIAGASPETLARLEDGTLYTFPLAGTRRRGADEREDAELERELLADEKELAEHNMLVDLGRNDVGRVCRLGSVTVERYLDVLRFSHVMHIGSTVSGRLREDRDAVDAVDSILPGGHFVRRAEDTRLRNNPRARGRAARNLRRRGRLSRFQRQHGHLHSDTARLQKERARLRPVGRGHRRRQRAGARVPRMRGQGAGGRPRAARRRGRIKIMLLLIDNYDSFAYNLYQLAGAFSPDVMVERNDALTADEAAALAPEAIFLSPGPGRPEDAGVCPALVRRFAGKIPIFGVCLECRLSATRSAGAYPTRGRSCTARYRKFRSRARASSSKA